MLHYYPNCFYCENGFGDYVNAITSAGLKLLQVEEPMPPESWKTESVGRYEEYKNSRIYDFEDRKTISINEYLLKQGMVLLDRINR